MQLEVTEEQKLQKKLFRNNSKHGRIGSSTSSEDITKYGRQNKFQGTEPNFSST